MEGNPVYGDTARNGTTLAHRPDFSLGNATIRPSLCQVEGPEGTVTTEPRVMEVLVTFADAGGAVLTRDDLMQACWRGAVVSDDAINRTIREARRAARATGADFGIDNIPRVGYRLTGAGVGSPPQEKPAPPAATGASPSTSRRWVLGAAVAVAGVGVVPFMARRPGHKVDPVVADLTRQGTSLLRTELKEQVLRAVELFDQALRIDPDNGPLWGKLALAWAYAAEHDVAGAIDETRRFAARARQLESGELNAEVATILVDRGAPDDWFATEQRLQRVLQQDPGHIPARLALGVQWQAAGYSRESKELNDGTIALDAKADGMQPDTLNRHAFLFWIAGSEVEALRVMERAPQQFPDNTRLWMNHLILRAFTGEYEAARVMVGRGPQGMGMPPDVSQAWLLALDALEGRSPEAIAAAERPVFTSSLSYVPKTMLLAELNLVDSALAVLQQVLRYKEDSGPPVVAEAPSNHNPRWRQYQWLFTPATRNLRADARFAEVARHLMLDRYWEQRGQPDDGPRCERCLRGPPDPQKLSRA